MPTTTQVVLNVRVYGIPVAQGRPRAFKTPSGAVRVYDPAASKDWKRTVLAQVLPVRPPLPLDEPLGMSLIFYLPRPKSLPRRVRRPVTRPDASNLLKAVEDALLGVVYRDDSLLVDLVVRKYYDPAPGVQILVWRVDSQSELRLPALVSDPVFAAHQVVMS